MKCFWLPSTKKILYICNLNTKSILKLLTINHNYSYHCGRNMTHMWTETFYIYLSTYL